MSDLPDELVRKFQDLFAPDGSWAGPHDGSGRGYFRWKGGRMYSVKKLQRCLATGQPYQWQFSATGDRHGARLHPESRPRGEGNPRSKMDWDKVRRLRTLHAMKRWSTKVLAEHFGISTATCWLVTSGRIWVEVEEE